ncbi:hypothetical protein PC9H_004399 [Pleurotus ostreatus]|uniref:Uncharacterized protein n=1 Tax=Pleurotus ostreatus TaxID=5322 RepID=A0A8H7DW64_PLEOS|nr:uncharacterized protein PC9H_004399 [Pleurotus ostreatus]KAF7437557.1 hypothetical protein PC9H_004399 [Pleurotus ostreatus]KAJ8703513.1 hypothetical protein PTI98_002131 [Pleurotus ostreatus]
MENQYTSPQGQFYFHPGHPATPIQIYSPQYHHQAYGNSQPSTPTPSLLRRSHSEASFGRPVRRYRTTQQKLETYLVLLIDHEWTIGDLLYHLFNFEAGSKKSGPLRSERHAQMVSKFLRGECDFGVGVILDLWLRSPSAIPAEGVEEEGKLYLTTAEYHKLKSAWPAITTLAAHLVYKQFDKELRQVVKKKSGLHTFSTNGSPVPLDNYGSKTFLSAVNTFKKVQPLTWDIILRLATPTPRRKAGQEVIVRRIERPPELVAAELLSSLAFTRNRYAKLVPASISFLYFACSANRYMYSLGSRIAMTTSYHAVYEALKKQAAHDQEAVRKLGSSLTTAIMLCLDNVQVYVNPRDPRLARQAHMLHGTAGTGFVVENFNPSALDLSKKHARLAENKRKDLTCGGIWANINHQHLDTVCIIQWLHTLVEYVPQLSSYKSAVQNLYAGDDKQ